MIAYLAKRLLLAAPTLLAVLTLVFVLVRIVPGDPAFVILGDQATEQALAELRARIGLDQPLWKQYLAFMGDVLTGDFGRSLVTNRPVMTDVLEWISARLPATESASVRAASRAGAV